MAINKVVYGTTVLVDLTEDTVTPASLQEGFTAHAKNGSQIFGTLIPGINPSGTYRISTNGTFNVRNYANCSVEIPTYDGSVV